MQSKYIVVIVITLVIIGGLFFFQKNKQNEELLAHKRQQFQRVTTIAKKSNSAGMLAMASAINKFHKVKGHYPSTLLKLYPEFIPERGFISELKWVYQPLNKSYILEKSVEGGGTIASMGPDLRLKTRSIMSSTPQKMVASVTKAKIPEKTAEKAVAQKPFKAEPVTSKSLEINQLAKISSQGPKKSSTDLNSAEKKKIHQSIPKISIIKKELHKDEKFLLSFDNAGLYIWKTREGVIGFSNIQYPDEKRLTIYKDQSWVEYVDGQTIKKN